MFAVLALVFLVGLVVVRVQDFLEREDLLFGGEAVRSVEILLEAMEGGEVCGEGPEGDIITMRDLT